MSSEVTSVKKESQEMISYYIETADGMYRTNVPKSWTVEIDYTRQGTIVAVFSDENGNDRLMYTSVQNIRDSSAQIQELVQSENQPEDTTAVNYEWVERTTSQPISRYTLDAITVSTRRRRRAFNIAEETLDYDDSFIE